LSSSWSTQLGKEDFCIVVIMPNALLGAKKYLTSPQIINIEYWFCYEKDGMVEEIEKF